MANNFSRQLIRNSGLGFLLAVLVLLLSAAPASAFSEFYVQTNAPTNIYNNQATLNGYVYGGAYATQVWFQYGTDTGYGYVTNSQQTNYSGLVSQNIANLMPNTTYHYRILGQTTSGQTVYGQDMTLYTGGGSNYYQPTNQASILDGIRQIIILLQQILSQLR